VPYFAVTRALGADWDHSRPMEEQEGWPEHARFMDDLASSGFIVLGGPVGDGRRILFACEAEDEDAVRARLSADPWGPSMLELSSVEPWAIRLDARESR
jgi:hypothetical protein